MNISNRELNIISISQPVLTPALDVVCEGLDRQAAPMGTFSMSPISRKISSFAKAIMQALFSGWSRSNRDLDPPSIPFHLKLVSDLEKVQERLNAALEQGAFDDVNKCMSQLESIKDYAGFLEDQEYQKLVIDTVAVLSLKPEIFEKSNHSSAQNCLLAEPVEEQKLEQEELAQITTQPLTTDEASVPVGDSPAESQQKKKGRAPWFQRALNAVEDTRGSVLESRKHAKDLFEGRQGRFERGQWHLEKRSKRLLDGQKLLAAKYVKAESARLKEELKHVVTHQVYKAIRQVQDDYRNSAKSLNALEHKKYRLQARLKLVQAELEYLNSQTLSHKAEDALHNLKGVGHRFAAQASNYINGTQTLSATNSESHVSDSRYYEVRNAKFDGIIKLMIEQQRSMLKGIKTKLEESGLSVDKQQEIYNKHLKIAKRDLDDIQTLAKGLSRQMLQRSDTKEFVKVSAAELEQGLVTLERQASKASKDHHHALGMLDLKGRVIRKVSKKSAFEDSMAVQEALSKLHSEVKALKKVNKPLAKELLAMPILEIKVPS